ncbi:MAG: glutamine amidotransferase class-I family protein [Micavibrio sp.]|nr:glutamine amidotransferase class-I family protein [Micavibrio sp.]
MGKAIIFRHMLDNDIGVLSHVLRGRGIEFEVIDTFSESLEGFDALAPDLLIVLGGACGVYQEDIYPFIGDEKRIIRERLDQDRPVLGICLGAQLMAAALGSKVYKGAQGKEIGWQTIDISGAGMQTPAKYFDKNLTRIMQWHGDTFDLPQGAVLLASSPLYENQVFQWGQRSIGFQCHIEVDRKTVRSWLVSEAYDVGKGGIDIPALQRETDEWAGVMNGQTHKFFHDWLDQIGL